MDRTVGIEAKFNRADQHIGELRQRLATFYATNPYAVGAKRDPDSGRPTYYIRSVASVPSDIPAIAGDALQCMRSALDHMAFQLVSIGKPGGASLEHVYFPIHASDQAYRANLKGQVGGARKEALQAISATRPYKGGNDLLWQLHKMNIVDKHRLLITAGGSFESVNVMRSMVQHMKLMPPEAIAAFSSMQLFLRPADKLFPLKPGDVLFTDGPDAEVDPHMEFRLPVATFEPAVLEPVPLEEFVDRVRRVVVSVFDTLAPFLAGATWPTTADLGY